MSAMTVDDEIYIALEPLRFSQYMYAWAAVNVRDSCLLGPVRLPLMRA